MIAKREQKLGFSSFVGTKVLTDEMRMKNSGYRHSCFSGRPGLQKIFSVLKCPIISIFIERHWLNLMQSHHFHFHGKALAQPNAKHHQGFLLRLPAALIPPLNLCVAATKAVLVSLQCFPKVMKVFLPAFVCACWGPASCPLPAGLAPHK